MILIMIESEPRIQTKPVTFYLISVWSLSDLIRYTYYMIRLFDADTFLKYAHYNVWIITYPLAFFFEGVILLRNIPYFDQTNSWSLDLPNHLNISFSMPLFIRIFLLIGFFPSKFIFYLILFFYYVILFLYYVSKKNNAFFLHYFQVHACN